MNPSYSFTRFAYLVAGVLGCHFVSLSGTGATFDAAADFATNSNPNGAWSYGYSTTLGGSVTQFPDSGNWAGLNYWRSPVLLGVPGVYHNPAKLTVTNSAGAAVHGPGGLTSYPGPNGEFCVIRFTAPDNGEYQVSGTFSGVDPLGTASSVYVLVNGVTFYGFVNGYGAGSGPTFNLLVDLALGHSIDFVVGRGADSPFRFNSTGVAVQINGPTGEPPGSVTNMLINVNFGAHLSPGLETNKVGLGAVGRSANDVWNFYSRDIAFMEWRL
ncbi:MAG: hypothetical protein IH623_26875, partial [Verrucomicrobia bacterium]|nr:hypothetical protein [Verrucomicrobiota bacterium]